MKVEGVSNVRLENLVIRGGGANGNYPDDRGGGIYLSNVSYSVFTNLVLSNNSATEVGGGVYVYYGVSNMISGSVYGNSASDGGGVFVEFGNNNVINANIYSNTSTTNGGGVYVYSGVNNMISGSVYGNSASQKGGGIFVNGGNNNTISGSVYGNSASYQGGGIFVSGNSNTISESVYGNSGIYGGGIYVFSGSYNTISGSVYGNSASYQGGGIFVNDSQNLSILNSYITNNWSTSSTNSVIHLLNSGSLTGLIISSNYIGGDGGSSSTGIYEDGLEDTTGHVLMDNKFITNTLSVLYHDKVSNDLYNITDVNDTSKTGATSGSTNNVDVNM
ncbi:MAG: hypothetical protein ACK4F9_02640 [Brevinematia bacterium]